MVRDSPDSNPSGSPEHRCKEGVWPGTEPEQKGWACVCVFGVGWGIPAVFPSWTWWHKYRNEGRGRSHVKSKNKWGWSIYDRKHKKHPPPLQWVGTKSQTLTLTQPSPYQTSSFTHCFCQSLLSPPDPTAPQTHSLLRPQGLCTHPFKSSVRLPPPPLFFVSYWVPRGLCGYWIQVLKSFLLVCQLWLLLSLFIITIIIEGYGLGSIRASATMLSRSFWFWSADNWFKVVITSAFFSKGSRS